MSEWSIFELEYDEPSNRWTQAVLCLPRAWPHSSPAVDDKLRTKIKHLTVLTGSMTISAVRFLFVPFPNIVYHKIEYIPDHSIHSNSSWIYMLGNYALQLSPLTQWNFEDKAIGSRLGMIFRDQVLFDLQNFDRLNTRNPFR